MKHTIFPLIAFMSFSSFVLADPVNKKDNVQHTEIRGVIINQAIGQNARSEQNIGGKSIPENTVIITTNGVSITTTQTSNKNSAGNSKSFVNKNLDGNNFSKQKLSNVSFTNASLVKANFQNSDLQNSDFTNTNMANANLKKANLKNADFTNANMADVDLRKSNLTGSNITNVNFTGANLEGAIWIDGRLCSANSIGACR